MSSARNFDPLPAGSPAGRPPVLAGQAAGPVHDFEELLGQGNDLWVDDAEFEAFLAELRRWRRQDRDETQRS
jgi:hypothetical protein